MRALALLRACPAPRRALPFPFLLLCWRIGLAGQWVRVPDGLGEFELPVLGAARSCPGSDALNGSAPLWRTLTRSALFHAVAAGQPRRAEEASVATVALLVSAPGPDRTRSMPPLWRPLARAVLPGPLPVYIPRPRARYDPLTWTLLDRLLEQWEAEGLTFLGAERRQLYLRAGTRRMARAYGVSRRRALACGRAAHRIWRHWYERREQARETRVRALPLPPDLHRTVEDPTRVYRALRCARRTHEPLPYLCLLPASLAQLLVSEADRSIGSFPERPTTPEWPCDPFRVLAQALSRSPLAVRAREAGRADEEMRRMAGSLARAVLRTLTAPWPWETGR